MVKVSALSTVNFLDNRQFWESSIRFTYLPTLSARSPLTLGQIALIGLGFQEKQVASDFQAELVSLTQRASNTLLSDAPSIDFSLAQGTKITMNLKKKADPPGGKASSTASMSTSSSSSTTVGASAFTLAPPPGGRGQVRIPGPNTSPSSSTSSVDLGSLFGVSASPSPSSSTTTSTTTTAPSTASAKKSSDVDFGDDWNF